MYRVFCESLASYQSNGDDYRSRLAQPLKLLADVDQYVKEKNAATELYKRASDLLWYMEAHTDVYPRFSAFLWTLESRDIKPKQYNISDISDLEEQAKLVNMMLKLVYWNED